MPGEGPQADRKRTAVAEVIGLDRFSGLALLKFKPDGELAHVEFDIRSEVSDGDAVAAIGWSLQDAEEFGQQTVQSDVRHSGQRVHYRNLIQLSNQHDASFIGSPLLSERGKVVGIVSKSGMSPIECAVPMSDVLRFLGVDDSEPVQ